MPGRRIAFYAPLKAPNHPIPSGDRRMGRLLIQALEAMGASVHVASDFRAYDGQGDPAHQATLRDIGLSLADDLIAHYQAMPRSARAYRNRKADPGLEPLDTPVRNARARVALIHVPLRNTD